MPCKLPEVNVETYSETKFEIRQLHVLLLLLLLCLTERKGGFIEVGFKLAHKGSSVTFSLKITTSAATQNLIKHSNMPS